MRHRQSHTRRPRDRRLAPGEFDRLLKAARASRCKMLPTAIELAVETAMRREELCSLTWADVDMNRRVAHLHLTKNGEPRDVPLSSRAVELLSQLVRPIHGGTVLRIKGPALTQAFRRVCRRAKLDNLATGTTSATKRPAGSPSAWVTM